MNLADIKNGGARARAAFAASGTATAGGAGDDTEVNGVYADRKGVAHGVLQSAKLVIAYSTTLAAAQTLTFAVTIQDATDSAGTGVEDYGLSMDPTVAATGAGTITGTMEIDVDLSGANQFIRAQITPDLSAANTDTVDWTASWVLFGGDKNPISLASASVKPVN